jgi:UDP:flavonoid glycosyltransferase YjiC (YdhE family)
MRVLFTVWAWPTHYFPLVPFAWACRAAGHDVRIASQPAIADTILRSGFSPVQVGRDLDVNAMYRQRLDRLRDREDGRLTRFSRWNGGPGEKLGGRPHVMQIHAAIARAMLDDLLAFARTWEPDVIVWDPGTYAGPIVARHLGARSLRHLWGPDIVRHTAIEDWSLPEFAELFGRFGLGPDPVLADHTIDPCPPSLQVCADATNVAVRYVPYTAPALLPRWAGERPGTRVCVTWGTTTARMTGRGAEMLPKVVDAIADLDLEILLTVTRQELEALPDMPPNVTVAEMLPLHIVLSTCSAIVHQGGPGTMLTAALAALPQVLIPEFPDQVLDAVQLARQGAGRHLPADDVSAPAIREALVAAINDPSMKASARALRAEMAVQRSYASVAEGLAALPDEARSRA